jgi:hypothetical protein
MLVTFAAMAGPAMAARPNTKAEASIARFIILPFMICSPSGVLTGGSLEVSFRQHFILKAQGAPSDRTQGLCCNAPDHLGRLATRVIGGHGAGRLSTDGQSLDPFDPSIDEVLSGN